jgi:hypothetical protein
MDNENDLYPPSNKTEEKIKLLLVMKGYNKKDIQFRSGLDDKERRYLRMGYWKGINPKDLEHISIKAKAVLTEEELFDSDCGWQYHYTYKLHKEE